jgi:hypothetical protein
MRIKRTKRKSGCYAQWFTVVGINERGQNCYFHIMKEQGDTYKKAIDFWNKTWGKNCKAFYIQNSEPFNDYYLQAC